MGKNREELLKKLELDSLLSLEDKVENIGFESLQEWKDYYYYSCKVDSLDMVRKIISIRKPSKNVSLTFAGKKPLETECEFKLSATNYEHIPVNSAINIEYVSTVDGKDLKVSVSLDIKNLGIENISLKTIEYEDYDCRGEKVFRNSTIIHVDGFTCQPYRSASELRHYTWYASNKEEKELMYKILGVNL